MVTGRIKPQKRTVCPACGDEMAARFFAKHEGSPRCVLEKAQRELHARGFMRCAGHYSIIHRAGISTIVAPSTLDSVMKQGYREANYAPIWAVKIAKFRDLSALARHIILCAWQRADNHRRGAMQTLLDADRPGLFLYCLGIGACCDLKTHERPFDQFGAGKIDQLLKTHTGPR